MLENARYSLLSGASVCSPRPEREVLLAGGRTGGASISTAACREREGEGKERGF